MWIHPGLPKLSASETEILPDWGKTRAETETARVVSALYLRFEPLNSKAIAPLAAICRSLGSVPIKRLFQDMCRRGHHMQDVNLATLKRGGTVPPPPVKYVLYSHILWPYGRSHSPLCRLGTASPKRDGLRKSRKPHWEPQYLSIGPPFLRSNPDPEASVLWNSLASLMLLGDRSRGSSQNQNQRRIPCYRYDGIEGRFFASPGDMGGVR